MVTEYGIVDQDGKLFGLPARTFTSREAANEVLEHIRERREEMALEAKDAAEALAGPFQNQLTEPHKDSLREVVRRWELEKPRSYRIVARRVSAWEAVA